MGGKLGKKIGIESQIFEVQQAHPLTILVKVTPSGPKSACYPTTKKKNYPLRAEKQTNRQTNNSVYQGVMPIFQPSYVFLCIKRHKLPLNLYNFQLLSFPIPYLAPTILLVVFYYSR